MSDQEFSSREAYKVEDLPDDLQDELLAGIDAQLNDEN